MQEEKGSYAIGSDAWLGASKYEPGSKWQIRADNFYETMEWTKLITIASRHKNNMACKFTDKYSIGLSNMVRRLVFDDGVSWVARLRLPDLPEFAGREILGTAKELEIEVASMKFLRAKTSFPVPEVHACDFSSDNEAGAPYILMDYIHGTTAYDLQVQHCIKSGQFGTRQQDRKFRQQMARIQVTLASFQFPKIGVLYYDQEAEDFYIGPELQTGLGPWSSSTEYYDDLSWYLLKTITERDLRRHQSFMLPSILNFLLHAHSKEINGPFRLTNRVFGGTQRSRQSRIRHCRGH